MAVVITAAVGEREKISLKTVVTEILLLCTVKNTSFTEAISNFIITFVFCFSTKELSVHDTRNKVDDFPPIFPLHPTLGKCGSEYCSGRDLGSHKIYG